MVKTISSIQNDLIRSTKQLQEKSRARKKRKLFVIEGARELDMAIRSGYYINTVMFCSEIISASKVNELISSGAKAADIIEVTKKVYEHLSHRKSTEGILSIAKHKHVDLSSLNLSKNPLILVAEGIEKPGNLGALLRTADAANIDAVILADTAVDLYNPNVIRSSVGCVFSNQIAQGSSDEVIAFLKQKQIRLFSAVLSDKSKHYYQLNYSVPTAIAVGTEATGLSELWQKEAQENVMIPMSGKIDSLNVSVSAAILIFEAKRQRSLSLK